MTLNNSHLYREHNSTTACNLAASVAQRAIHINLRFEFSVLLRLDWLPTKCREPILLFYLTSKVENGGVMPCPSELVIM